MINNKDIKEVLMIISHREGLKQGDILDIYNRTYNKNITKQSFSRSLKDNTMKHITFLEVLESIGYEIEIKKKI